MMPQAFENDDADLPCFDDPLASDPDPLSENDRDSLPIIQQGTKLADDIDHAIRALAADPNLYTRDGALVHVVRTSGIEASTAASATNGERRMCVVEGTPVVRSLPVATLRARLTRFAAFQKRDARRNRWVASLPSDPLVQGVMSAGEWPALRELVGVIEAPSLRADGTPIDQPGYDAATRFLYAPSSYFPAVPKSPSQTEARTALDALCEVFCDFPFASEPARYVPIAATLSLIARPGILGPVPLFLFDAPTPGTGKSLCSDAVCAIATGRPAPRGTFPPSVEELEKVLSAYALRSASVIGFDNIASGLGGDPLDKVLTAADTVDLRVLGTTEIRSMRWRAVVLASGNNVVLFRDTARRGLIARMESSLERPEERQGFRHSPLLPWITSNRARLLVAALTVLRAFFAAGKPSMGLAVFGSFEAWTDVIAAAIVYAGGANVLEARPTEEAGDSGERGATVGLFGGLARLDTEGRGKTARELIQVLYPVEREPGPPDGFDDLREAIEFFAPPRNGRPPDANKLGAQLRRLRQRIAGGLRFVGASDRKGVVRWRVEHVGG